MIVKMTIFRLLGSSDDKNWRDREEIQVEKIKTKTICYHRLNRDEQIVLIDAMNLAPD